MKILLLIILQIILLVPISAQPQLELVPFASGLDQPIGIYHAGDDRLFVIEQGGYIRILDHEGQILETPFLDLTEIVNTSGNERGLLGMAFHPQYHENGYFFVNYTRTPDGATVVARYEVSADEPDVADAESEKIIMTIQQPYSNHNAGDLLFGPDGYLYIAVGDGGSGGDPDNYSQTHTTWLGKMLRIDIDNGDPYTIPEDNPFAWDDFTLDEIWALGLRNHWRNSFDRYTGDLWIADVGQSAMEEINFQPANSTGGENYGWRCYEGTLPYNTDDCGDPEYYTFPVFEYEHYGGGCSGSVTGGYVYRGALYSALFGYYLAADYCKGDFYYVLQTDNGFEGGLLDTFSPFQYASFGEDQHGELYVALRGAGEIQRINELSDCSPVARIKGDNLLSLAEGETILLTAFYHPSLHYQWYRNDQPIAGAEDFQLEVDDFGVYTVEVTNPGNECSNLSMPVEVMIEEPTGLVEVLESSLNVYPNPASGIMTIEGLPADAQADIILYDLRGVKMRFIKNVATPKVSLDISGLPSGVYLLQVRLPNGGNTTRMVVVGL